MPDPRFGIEEEFLLLDIDSATPANVAPKVFQTSVTPMGESEFLECQIENSTPICRNFSEAFRSLQEFRRAASLLASKAGCVLAGTGLPPILEIDSLVVSHSQRYAAVAAALRSGPEVHWATGLHVHIEVPSADVGVEVMVRAAPWYPLLIAMTANSPIWRGMDTGFASWRYMLLQQWPLRGFPPEFRDGDEYHAAVQRLIECKIIADRGAITWAARLSEQYPTVEFRLADAQIDAADSVGFALTLRALVRTILTDIRHEKPRPKNPREMLHAAAWLAARDGLSHDLVDIETGCLRPATDLVVERVHSLISVNPWDADAHHIEAYIQRLIAQGEPASRQRAQFHQAGAPGLLHQFSGGSSVRNPESL